MNLKDAKTTIYPSTTRGGKELPSSLALDSPSVTRGGKESRASNIPMDKGNYVCCHNSSNKKDLRRICRNQYEHPGSSIGY